MQDFFTKKNSVAIILAALVLVAMALTFYYTRLQGASTAQPDLGQWKVLTPKPANENAKSYGDDPVLLSNIPGPKVVMLWSLGCLPCIKSLLLFEKMHAFFDQKGVKVVPILISHQRDRPAVYWGSAVVFLSQSLKKGATWKEIFPHLTPYYDGEGKAFELIDIQSTPTFLYLSKTGKIVEKQEGFQDWQSAGGREVLDKLLDRLKAAA